MKKRISKKVREEAIWGCAIAASNPGVSLAAVIDSDDAFSLALLAQCHVPMSSSYAVDCAGAEALLRTGWTPEGWS